VCKAEKPMQFVLARQAMGFWLILCALDSHFFDLLSLLIISHIVSLSSCQSLGCSSVTIYTLSIHLFFGLQFRFSTPVDLCTSHNQLPGSTLILRVVLTSLWNGEDFGDCRVFLCPQMRFDDKTVPKMMSTFITPMNNPEIVCGKWRVEEEFLSAYCIVCRYPIL
jgi:hypothetical protein